VTFPKGNRKREKALAKRAQGAWVVQVRAEVWERSRGRCETCGDTEFDTARKSLKFSHEMNELVPRSQTRGKPPEERFNTRICIRQCPLCHHAFHAGDLRVRPVSEQDGGDGNYSILTRRRDAHGRRTDDWDQTLWSSGYKEDHVEKRIRH